MGEGHPRKGPGAQVKVDPREVEEAAREHGSNLAELTGSKPRKTGTVAPKYANPQDPTMTWTGRGRKPRWVQENLESGKELDDLLI